MTRDEYYGLQGRTGIYEFHLYQGGTHVGFITELGDKFYIVRNTPDNREKPIPEKGVLVELEQIDFWEQLETARNRNESQQQKINLMNNSGKYDFTYHNTPKATKMIIVGAGASYDFTFQNTGVKPPLGNELFNDHFLETLEKYPGAFNLSSDIIRSNDIEEFFETKWNQIVNNYDIHSLNRLINTQYYIHDLFRNLSKSLANNRKNNYWSLVSKAHDFVVQKKHREHILFVSFNYDTLLEEAFERMPSYQFKNIYDYTDMNRRKLLLFKPHGSSNWIRKFRPSPHFIPADSASLINSSMEMANLIYQNNFSLSLLNRNLENEINIFESTSDEEAEMNSLKNFYYPGLLIPYKNKDELIMPIAHSQIMDHFLSNISDILIIGWKGNENVFMKKLQRLMGSKEINIYYANFNDDSIEGRLKNFLPKSQITNMNSLTGGETTFTTLMQYCLNKPDFFFSG